MLVAGHGYNDPGAVGNGTNERDFIRNNITKKLKVILKKKGIQSLCMVVLNNHKICTKILHTEII